MWRAAQAFQWTENVYGDLMLLSLATHQHLRVDSASGVAAADHPGLRPDREDGSCFVWKTDAK
jgi:xylan 1,4-beta-xylosidase